MSEPPGGFVTSERFAEEACKQLDRTVMMDNETLKVGKAVEERETIDELPEKVNDQNTEIVSEKRALEQENDCRQKTKQTRRNKEYEALVDAMKKLRENYEETKETVEQEIRNFTLTKNLILKDIRSLKEELLSRLDDLEKNSIDIVNKRFKTVTENMKTTTRKIDDILKQIDETLKECQHDKKPQTDKIKKVTAALHDKKIKINTDIGAFQGVNVCLDRNIKTFLDRATGLVKVNLPCQVNLKRNVDITFESDRETCGISDICSLPDGTFVMTDLSNDCLKRLDESYNRKGTLHLDGGPLGICATRNGELAVTLRESRVIQFVEYTETEMKLTNSFPADCLCNYICCIDKTLFVTCEGGDEDNGLGLVRKFDMAGNVLGIFGTDNEDHRMFTTPLHITTNTDKSRLLVTDMDSKVIILDKTGKKLGEYRNNFLDSPFGISVLPNDNILVSSVDTHSVQQFDDKCRYVGTILNESNGIQNPVCIKFNASKRQIIVSMDDCNKLLVFSTSSPST